jgi:hypothetical protein
MTTPLPAMAGWLRAGLQVPRGVPMTAHPGRSLRQWRSPGQRGPRLSCALAGCKSRGRRARCQSSSGVRRPAGAGGRSGVAALRLGQVLGPCRCHRPAARRRVTAHGHMPRRATRPLPAPSTGESNAAAAANCACICRASRRGRRRYLRAPPVGRVNLPYRSRVHNNGRSGGARGPRGIRRYGATGSPRPRGREQESPRGQARAASALLARGPS